MIAVNQELFDHNEQFTLARLYAEAIVATTHEPILVLNNDFRIKSTNKKGKGKFSDWELTHVFPVLGKRTICFNAQPVQRENQNHRILLALEDITERKRRQVENKELLTRFQNLVSQAPVAILILKGTNYQVELPNGFNLNLVEQENDFVGKPFLNSFRKWKSRD